MCVEHSSRLLSQHKVNTEDLEALCKVITRHLFRYLAVRWVYTAKTLPEGQDLGLACVSQENNHLISGGPMEQAGNGKVL